MKIQFRLFKYSFFFCFCCCCCFQKAFVDSVFPAPTGFGSMMVVVSRSINVSFSICASIVSVVSDVVASFVVAFFTFFFLDFVCCFLNLFMTILLKVTYAHTPSSPLWKFNISIWECYAFLILFMMRRKKEIWEKIEGVCSIAIKELNLVYFSIFFLSVLWSKHIFYAIDCGDFVFSSRKIQWRHRGGRSILPFLPRTKINLSQRQCCCCSCNTNTLPLIIDELLPNVYGA